MTEKITYYLDGKEIAADQLAGKSGKVRIHIDYTNNMKYKDVYVPFAAVTGMAFANDTARNVKVDNGSIVTEGKNTMIVGMAFPGLEDSLKTVRSQSKEIVNKIDDEDKQKQLDRIDDLDIPGSVDITMDAENFKMSTCLTMVFSNLFEMEEEDNQKFDEDHRDAFDEMDEKVADLEKDGDDLADGTQELVDGVQEAKDGTEELYDGTERLIGTNNSYGIRCLERVATAAGLAGHDSEAAAAAEEMRRIAREAFEENSAMVMAVEHFIERTRIIPAGEAG